MSDRVETIANVDALAEVPETDWSKKLEAVSKTNELANQNLVQQNTITYQQALSQIAISGISKCFEMISHVDPADDRGQKRIETYRDMIEQFNQMVQTASLLAAKANSFPGNPQR